MRVLAIVLGMLAGSVAFAQDGDPVLGMWKTEIDDGSFAHIDMHVCGEAICGTIARTFDSDGEYESENLGKDIVRNMVPKGGGKYRGKVWRPSNDKIYIGKLVLNGDSLKMKGCVAGGLICSSQTWSRLE